MKPFRVPGQGPGAPVFLAATAEAEASAMVTWKLGFKVLSVTWLAAVIVPASQAERDWTRASEA